MFVIGQEQDSLGGGFSSIESFIGQLTQLNVWSRELSFEEIAALRLSCNKQVGDVIAWVDISGKAMGSVLDTPIHFCEGNARRRKSRLRRNQCLPVSCNSNAVTFE